MATTQQSIEKLNKYTERLELLNKQLEDVNKNSKEYKKLTAEKLKVEEKAVKASKELGTAQGKLSSTLKNHQPLIKKANDAQRRFNKTTRDASKVTKGFFSRLKTAVGTLSRYAIAYNLINAAQRLFTELTIGSAKQAIAFEKALGNLSAVAGVSGESLQKLADNAEQVAGQTKFTAEEIVGLQTELSKLGFTANEVIDATQGIALTAQALGSPLNTTAEMIGKVINQFSLLRSETNLVGDILLTTFNESALSFESFGTAIQYVGPIARQLNLDLEQTAGAMAVLADNGFTASRIGTGLRGILTEIGKTSVDAEEELKRLAEQNISLSEAVDLVGKRNAAQLITLLNNIEAIDESTDKYYEQGRAQIAAAEKADTFSGQVEILNSAWNAFRRSLGEFVVESDAILSILSVFSTEAARTARSFGFLADVDVTAFNDSVSKVREGSNSFVVALELLKQQGDITEKQFKDLKEAGLEGVIDEDANAFFRLTQSMGYTNKATRAFQDLLGGVIDRLKETADTRDLEAATVRGQTTANDVFGGSVKNLIDLNRQNFDVTKDVDDLYEQIEYSIGNRQNSLESLTESEKVQRAEIESEIETLKQLQTTLVNIESQEESLTETRKKNLDETKDKYGDLRDQVFNQKSARQFNEIITSAYSDVSDNIKTARQELSEFTEGTQAYAEKLDEIEYLSKLEDSIKSFKLSEKEIENVVKQLYDWILVSASRQNLDGLSETLNKAFEEELSRLVIGEDGQITTEPIELTSPVIYKPKEGSDEDPFSFLQRLGLESQKSFQELMLTLQEEGAEMASGIYKDIAAERLQVINDELDSELDSIKNRYEVEGEILKSQLDNQLITDSQFRQKKKEIRKAELAEENSVEKERFEAEKKQDINNAKSDYLSAVAQAFINEILAGTPFPQNLTNSLITSGGAAIAFGGQLTAINQRKFVPRKFEQGGVVEGPSHSEGGVPFTVKGRQGYEMEGGEFIVNKKATAMHRSLLERINNSERTAPQIGKMKFAEGGLVPNNPASESVDYLKAIAEATTSTAIGVSKPVRAFVADKDLRSNATERRLRDRNDRI